MTIKWWQTRPSRPERPHRIHPYKIETNMVGGRVIVGDMKEGKNSILASLGRFDVELLSTNEMFEQPGAGLVDFPEDVLLLPFSVNSGRYKNVVEPSGDVAVDESPLSVRSRTQVAGELISVLVHPRLRRNFQSGSLTASASVLASTRDPDPPREVGLSFRDGALVFEEGATIGVSCELMLVVGRSDGLKAGLKVSSFDFVAVMRELRWGA